MPKKTSGKSNTSIFILPLEICRDAIRYVSFCVIYRPVYCMFVCSSITVLYLILSSQKVQEKLASLPYEQFIANFKSQRMITLYATVVEVVLELLMAVILAGVSVLITLWLVVEEYADKKNMNRSNRNKLNLVESSSFAKSTTEEYRDLHSKSFSSQI